VDDYYLDRIGRGLGVRQKADKRKGKKDQWRTFLPGLRQEVPKPRKEKRESIRKKDETVRYFQYMLKQIGRQKVPSNYSERSTEEFLQERGKETQ